MKKVTNRSVLESLEYAMAQTLVRQRENVRNAQRFVRENEKLLKLIRRCKPLKWIPAEAPVSNFLERHDGCFFILRKTAFGVTSYNISRYDTARGWIPVWLGHHPVIQGIQHLALLEPNV